MITRDTMISTEGEEVKGNDANRFDQHSQSGTIGPEPESPSTASPETGGGEAPKGT